MQFSSFMVLPQSFIDLQGDANVGMLSDGMKWLLVLIPWQRHMHTGWPPIVPRRVGHPAWALMTCPLSEGCCGARGVAAFALALHSSETAWSIWLPVQMDGVLVGDCLWLWCHSVDGKAHPGSAIAVRHRGNQKSEPSPPLLPVSS